MTSDQTRKRILEEALNDIPFDGWTNEVLRKAGARLQISADEIELLFPGGATDLLEYFSLAADRHMTDCLAEADLPSMKIRERITLAVWSRIAFLEEHREAALRATSVLALPVHSVLTAKLIAGTCDAAWRGIGDSSTDFNFYTKRATLSLVISSTMLFWMSDESEGLEETRGFLDRRIENVMQFEKAKGQVKARLENLPNPFELLAKIRKPGSRFKA